MAIRGLTQLLARFAAVQRVPRELSREWQIRTIAGAKRRHLPNKKTGHTSRTITAGRLDDHGATVQAGGAAVFLEGGTKPHVIRPRRKKALRFATGGNARLTGSPRTGAPVVFAKRVNHPGSKAYPFLKPAGQEALREVGVKSVVRAWNEAA
jgi:hypothetical protein